MFTAKTPWIVLLFLWMGGSTWWHVCKIKQLCGDAPQPSSTTAADPMPALSIVDGEKLNLTVPGNFRYAKSDVLADAGAVGNTLPTLANYLKANA
ncbi:MAG TPA: flagellar motor protein MotB, partial [Fibrella sp.]